MGLDRKGTKPDFDRGTKIAGKDSGISVGTRVTPEFTDIVKHDYPDYVLE